MKIRSGWHLWSARFWVWSLLYVEWSYKLIMSTLVLTRIVKYKSSIYFKKRKTRNQTYKSVCRLDKSKNSSMLFNVQLNLNIVLLLLTRNHKKNAIKKSKKELPESKDNLRRKMPESIKPSLNSYKKNVKRELRRPQEKKNFLC